MADSWDICELFQDFICTDPCSLWIALQKNWCVCSFRQSKWLCLLKFWGIFMRSDCNESMFMRQPNANIKCKHKCAKDHWHYKEKLRKNLKQKTLWKKNFFFSLRLYKIIRSVVNGVRTACIIMVNKTTRRGHRTPGIIFFLKIFTNTIIRDFQWYPVTIQACNHLVFGNRLQINNKSHYSNRAGTLLICFRVSVLCCHCKQLS